MSVAPFLPRHGVAYIPRPALGILAAQAGAGVVNVTANGITLGRGAGVATLRVFNADGDRIHDLTSAYETDDDQTAFNGVTVTDARPHRVEVLTSHGQRGSAMISSATPPANPTLTSINPNTVVADSNPDITLTGTNFSATDEVRIVEEGNSGFGNPMAKVFVNATTITAQFRGDEDTGDWEIFVRSASGHDTARRMLTITAPAALKAPGSDTVASAAAPEPAPKASK